YSQAGVVTPDHTIRTKNWPLVVPAPEGGKFDDFKRDAQAAAQAYVERYQGYFARHNARVGGRKIALDPLPRVVLVPGLGLLALLDVDAGAARARANAIGGAALALECDVTDAASVNAAFARVVEMFGGVDIVVSNAGAAWQGRIGEVDEELLRRSFELNFYGH